MTADADKIKLYKLSLTSKKTNVALMYAHQVNTSYTLGLIDTIKATYVSKCIFTNIEYYSFSVKKNK